MLAHEAQIAHREVAQVRRHDIEVGVRNAEPLRERGRELVRGGRRDKAATTDVLRTADLQFGVAAEKLPAVDRIADDDLVPAPGVIGAVTVRRQGAAKIGLRERGYAFGYAELYNGIVECRHRLTDVC